MSKLPCEFELGGECCQADELTRGRVPRVARLMALAVRFERLVRDGVVADYAELARLGHVSRARMSQAQGLPRGGPSHGRLI